MKAWTRAENGARSAQLMRLDLNMQNVDCLLHQSSISDSTHHPLASMSYFFPPAPIA
jgi:hypothetical protein